MRLLQTCGYPDPERGDVMELFTREAAIEQAKAAAKAGGHVYASDEDALADFCVVHWATWVEVDIVGDLPRRPVSNMAALEAAVHLSSNDPAPGKGVSQAEVATA